MYSVNSTLTYNCKVFISPFLTDKVSLKNIGLCPGKNKFLVMTGKDKVGGGRVGCQEGKYKPTF